MITGTELAARLARRAEREVAYVARMEKLASRQLVPPKDIERVYAGAYLGFFNQFEQAIEELFVGLITKRVALSAQTVRPLLSIASVPVTRRVVAGGKSYADWLPFEQHTLRRAPAFFAQGRPFETVSRADRTSMTNASVIRNAIAHGSKHARARFIAVFVEGKSLPPHQQQPAGYLRGTHASGQTRLEFNVAELTAVFFRLCA